MKQLEELFKRVTGKTFQEAADELNAGKTVEEFSRDMAAHEALGKAKVNCLQCGKPINHTQGTCPHCGYKEF